MLSNHRKLITDKMHGFDLRKQNPTQNRSTENTNFTIITTGPGPKSNVNTTNQTTMLDADQNDSSVNISYDDSNHGELPMNYDYG